MPDSKLSDSHDSRDHRDGREMREKHQKSYRDSEKSNNHVKNRSPLSRGWRHGSDMQVSLSTFANAYRWQDLKYLFQDEVTTEYWQTLQDQFGDVGNIKFAEMRKKDVAIIRFSNENEASRTVSSINLVMEEE